jgi:hypothetical protein
MTEEKITRLQDAIRKLSGWAGVDIQDMIDEGYLEDEDMS